MTPAFSRDGERTNSEPAVAYKRQDAQAAKINNNAYLSQCKKANISADMKICNEKQSDN